MNYTHHLKETSISTASNSIKYAARILKAFDIEPVPADRLVERYLREHREIHSRDRRAIADWFFGTLRWRRRLEVTLKKLGVQRPTPEQLVESYVAWSGEEGELLTLDKRFPGGAAAFWSFPDHIYELLVNQLGEEGAEKLMEALNQPAPITVRVNLIKTTRDELERELSREGIEARLTEFSPYGLFFPHRTNFSSLECYRKGWFEVQDEASQLASQLVKAREGEVVLDACAGGGGKSLFFAMEMNNIGAVLATDTDEYKLKNLRRRASRAGATCIRSVPASKLKMIETYKGECDAVVVDAPCSGTGTIRRNPDLKWRISAAQINEYPKKQIELLHEYSAWVKPQGRLIYITCSLLKQENEEVATKFAEQSGFQIEGDFFRTLPSEVNMDGFFVCVFRQTAES